MGPIQCLHLGLLIHTQDDRVLRSIQIQPHDVDHLGDEVGVGRLRERPDSVQFHLECAEDLADGVSPDSSGLGWAAHAPVSLPAASWCKQFPPPAVDRRPCASEGGHGGVCRRAQSADRGRIVGAIGQPFHATDRPPHRSPCWSSPAQRAGSVVHVGPDGTKRSASWPGLPGSSVLRP